MKYDKEMSRVMSKLDLNFEMFGYKFTNYWCRVVIDESKIFNNKRHKHSFYELHLCLNGECTFVIHDKEYKLTKGKFILCDQSCRHLITSMSPNFEKLVWGFDFEEKEKTNLKESLSKALNDIVMFDYSESVQNILSSIFDDVKNKPRGYLDTIKANLFLLFNELVRPMVENDKKEETSRIADYRMKLIEIYIDDNILQRVKIEDISKEFDLCEKQLSRICQINNGVTIGKYLLQKKIEKAKELLINTDRTLSDLADHLGYSDVYSFSKAFKRCEGMSPISFKKSINM